jgi:hypothetical protein
MKPSGVGTATYMSPEEGGGRKYGTRDNTWATT